MATGMYASNDFAAIVDALSLQRADAEAVALLARLSAEAYDDARARGALPVTEVLRNPALAAPLSRGGAEALLIAKGLTLFAQGVAAGRGRREIVAEDVETTRNAFCDMWPNCSLMRLEADARALSLVPEVELPPEDQ